MGYLIVTIINFLLIYICSHFFLINKNYNNYWKREKEYERSSLPIWGWIIVFIIGLLSYCGLLICLIAFFSLWIGIFIDDDIIIDPKISSLYKRTWLGKLLTGFGKLLTKRVSI